MKKMLLASVLLGTAIAALIVYAGRRVPAGIGLGAGSRPVDAAPELSRGSHAMG